MPSIDRRSFLAFVAAAGAAAPLRARTLKTVGVQLYTVRSILPQNPLETLRAIESIGYREAELTADNLDKTLAALKQTALKPVSLHLDASLFSRNTEKLPAALESAKGYGLSYVVCPYVAPNDRGGPEAMRKLAESLNKAGEIANRLGMRLCYHNHAFEFQPAGNGTLLDVLLAGTDPKLVGLELDIMWSQVAGVDPAAALKQYGSRIPLLHIKNVAEGIEKRYNEGVARTAFREVGNGVINIPAVLAAAEQAGVQHYFVEQDQTPGDPLASLRQSYEYLAKLNF